MVKKLIKHEFVAFNRTLLPIEFIMLGIALLTRFVQLFENDTTAFKIVGTSSVIMFVICMIVLLVATFFVGITRFYKNLFTLEGYLSFTLPVTTSQHIFTKLLVSIVYTFISLVNIVVSVCIATAGEMCSELFKAAGYILKHFFDFAKGHSVPFILEAILLVILLTVSGYLLFFACISVGQLAKKNRVLAAFGAYFVYYVITQIVGTVIIIVGSIIVENVDLDPLIHWIVNNPFATTHICLCGGCVLALILSAIWYLISYKIIKNKLNLE